MKQRLNKMLLLYIFVAFVVSAFFATTCFSATAGTLKEVGNIGGESSNFATGVATYPNGDFVISGWVYSDAFGNGDFTSLTGKGSFDALVAVFSYNSGDSKHNVGYMYNFGGADFDRAERIITRSNGGFAFVGYSEEDSFGADDWAGIDGFGGADGFLVKSDGDLNSNPIGKAVGTEYDDSYNDIVELSNGDIVAVGGSMVNYSSEFAALTLFPANGGNPVSIAFNNESNDSVFYGVTAGKDDCPVVVGSADIGNGWNGLFGNGNEDAVIIKYDKAGNEIWKKSFGGAGDDYFVAVTTTTDGGYVAVGSSSSNSFGNGSWEGFNGKGFTDAIIVKYDSDGTLLWKYNFGGGDDDYFASVAPTADGGCVAIGQSGSYSFGDNDWIGINGKGDVDAIIARFGANDDILWKYNFGGADLDVFNDVAVKENGDIVAVGESYFNSFDAYGDFAGLTITGDCDIIYAIFNDIDVKNVKFLKYSNNEDLIYAEESVISGGSVALPTDPVRNGFTFTGWYRDKECTVAFNPQSITENITVYPKWTPVTSSVLITYFANGFEFPQSKFANFADNVTVTTASSLEGKTFIHWEDQNGYIRSYNPTYKFVATEDTWLQAVYETAPVIVKPTVNIDYANKSMPNGARTDVSFFGDVVVPSGFTVKERGFIGSYYRSEGIYARTTENFNLGSEKINKIIVKGTSSKIQGNFLSVAGGENYCSRTFLTYSDGTNDYTIYSPFISVYSYASPDLP